MKKKLHKLVKASSVFGVMFATTMLYAQTAITVENGDFSLPGTKQQNWSSVPGWSSDTPATDSGVEAEGTAFLKSSDPSVYNITSHVIASGEEYTLTIGSLYEVYNAETGNFTTTLFYTSDSGLTRTPLGSQAFLIADGTWQLSVSSIPDAVGANLGIEFENESSNGGDGWHGFDDITLEYSNTLGVNDFKLDKNAFKVYPNPVKGSAFKIQLNDTFSGASVNVKIYDILGKTVLNKDFYASRTIELSPNLKAGIYLVKVNDQSTSKLVIK